MNILWHNNPDIDKFCRDLKLAINPITLDGNIYAQFMIIFCTKGELAHLKTLEDAKLFYISRLETLISEIKKDLIDKEQDGEREK